MNAIRRLRLQFGKTQKMLASMLGTSQPAVAAYEAGAKSPTVETLEKMAGSLNLEVAISFVPRLTAEDLRSLAYHQAIVEKLQINPNAVLERARKNLKMMSQMHPDAKWLMILWEHWLELPMIDLIGCCLDAGLIARDMRQVTPFAGVLSASERREILKKFRKEMLRK